MDERRGEVTTSDGVGLRYLEVGSGRPLVLIHGWSQAAELFRRQIDGLSDRYRVIAYDQRGHGESDKPAFGYRISRLAKDLHDVLTALDLHDVAAVGHSMGCSVLWCYWDLFGAERLAKLILVDQAPFLTDNPAWSPAERAAAGAMATAEERVAAHNRVAASTGEAPIRELVEAMTTGALDPAVKAWIVEHNLKMPRAAAATLSFNHGGQDWRDVIPRITLPTLVVGGRASLISWRSQAWIHEHIPNLAIASEQLVGNIDGRSANTVRSSLWPITPFTRELLVLECHLGRQELRKRWSFLSVRGHRYSPGPNWM
jgi:non-heme chloroperoxidase